MKRSVLTRQQNHQRIAAAGTDEARKKFEASQHRIREAMKTIEADVEKHAGIYPLAGGRITTAEVLLRAGKSEAYLRKKNQLGLLELKEEVENFVDRANALIARGARSIRKNITDRIAAAKSEADAVKQAYAEAELELGDTLKKLQLAEKTVEELRAENRALQQQLAGNKVVKLEKRPPNSSGRPS
jgi:hypothetical protein